MSTSGYFDNIGHHNAKHLHRGGTDYGDCSYRARTTPLG